MTNAQDILHFWFEETPSELHFKKDAEFDQTIIDHYAHLIDALAGQIDTQGKTEWEGTPEGDLASIIVLDQFPRNSFRGSPKTFATDEKAVDLARRALARKSYESLPDVQRSFLFMPFMHSEDLATQELSLKCFQDLMESDANIPFAIDHLDIIKRFGRFPHRNEVLGRESTEEELAFLADGGFAG